MERLDGVHVVLILTEALGRLALGESAKLLGIWRHRAPSPGRPAHVAPSSVSPSSFRGATLGIDELGSAPC
jgi:hypothetical protein